MHSRIAAVSQLLLIAVRVDSGDEICFIDTAVDVRIVDRIPLILPAIRVYSNTKSPKQGRAALKMPCNPFISKLPTCAFAWLFIILGNRRLVIFSREKSNLVHRVYHHSTGPSPDCDIEAYIVEHIPFPNRNCTYCDAIGAPPLRCRLITSLGRRRGRYVVPLLVLHADSDPLILVVEVFVAIIHPSPNLLLHIAGNQVKLTEKAIGSKCRSNKPEACAEKSGREDGLGL